MTQLEALLGEHFDDVQLHVLASRVVLRDPAPLVRHAASTSAWRVADHQSEEMTSRFAAEVRKVIEGDGVFSLTAEVALFTAHRR